ncbi:SDR family NAD(P)-dependent oxidoreductase [Iamia sp.]|uniref:SDR family NAD(P)-dependent oxidoreductase n=1 Tax=Iamia sp. TaxID=2722710 RepID=UPI002C18B685|nr:SDR family oxidoreductase [Iamia sp.]HXH58760.1 SDR family oxidoreductase [Iamia sp.]
MDLTGKTALVTGGSRGIGAAIATGLADHGADVAFTYLNRTDRAMSVAADIKAAGRRGLPIHADSAQRDSVTDAVIRATDALGGLDILVNNAGIAPLGPLEDVTAEEVERTIAIHVIAPFVASQAAATVMHDGGRIITIGSCFVDRVPEAGVTLYAASKAATVGMTKGLARDLGPRGITANVVHPGSTDTEMNPADGPTASSERRHIALDRYGTPDEVAAMVVFLASDEARYVTGAALSVDGGFAA